MRYIQVFQHFEKMESEDIRFRKLGIVDFPDSRPLLTSKLFIFKRLLSVNDFTETARAIEL